MFQFSHLPFRKAEYPGMTRDGFPIRESPAKLARQLTGAFRSLAAPFIGPWPQGIHRGPLIT